MELVNIDKNKLTQIMEYGEDEQKQLVKHTVKDNLLFYVMHRNGTPFVIQSGCAERIGRRHPEPIFLDFHSGHNLDPEDIILKEKFNLNSVWVEEERANQLLGLSSNSNNVHRYSTKLLEIQNKVIQKFWLNYDPYAPPKGAEIIAWILVEFKALKISKRMAIAIDAIVRPNGLKSGGKKKIDK
ncbi:MAG: hypothetical protein HYX60_07570 [Legionella longbeachae]|nr:hypothetical protein [Legionella longbeachae]